MHYNNKIENIRYNWAVNNPQTRVIDIVTPKRYTYKGLLFGLSTAKRAIIFVHGLSASALTNHELVVPLVDTNTMVITLNNRGHDVIAGVKKLDNRKRKGYKREWAGMAFEKFTDCVDDIQGAIDFAQSLGAKDIYLAGHSTGCQKSIFYLSRIGKQKYVKGVILLCPMSDYAAMMKQIPLETYKKNLRITRKMVGCGDGNKLIPSSLDAGYITAQRYISLYAADSVEEIFTYIDPQKQPQIFQKVKIPMLIVIAENDEYLYHNATETAKWFSANTRSHAAKVEIIANATHNLETSAEDVIKIVNDWLTTIRIH